MGQTDADATGPTPRCCTPAGRTAATCTSAGTCAIDGTRTSTSTRSRTRTRTSQLIHGPPAIQVSSTSVIRIYIR